MHMQNHSAFELIRQVPVTALNLTVEHYRHKNTGAEHFHFASNNPENVFLLALRTVPMDHKGVAHILEHTALCGSERYPARDPFFMMIRRSLNTFMNAFTSNDWTAYPFASQNRKDFSNLLDVYLDAVFFSRLDELDFLQEGHRLEFAEADNQLSPLVHKGVVYNEMKGAMSSISSVLWQTLCKYLFPNTTYHFNSGGEPEHITDLSYQELRDFYQAHYHPSNAIFMTFGDIPACEHHPVFEEKALSRFSANEHLIDVGREKRYHAPIRVQESYAFDSDDEIGQKTHIVLGWLLGQNIHLSDVLSAQLLNYVLLENSACPLQHYLETTPLGSSPSPLCGMEDSYRELVFCCGITGSEAEHADTFEQEVLAIFQQVAEQGIPYERLKAIVHQIELSHREISGDGFPYGLQVLMMALPGATHRGDLIELLDLEPALDELHEAIKQPDYIKQLIQQWLLDNRHRVRLVMTPDTTLSHHKEQAEQTQLEQIKAQLSEQDKQHIVKQAQALAERQARIDDDSILPKVTLDDVPATLNITEGDSIVINDIELHRYIQGTNGLVYQQLILPLPALNEQLLKLLPLYSQLLTEVGIADKSYAEVQHWQSEAVGSINAFISLRGDVHDEQKVPGYLVLSAKALAHEQQAMAELLKATLQQARFDELPRLRDIVSQSRNSKEQSVTGNGHILAMTAAASGLSPLAHLNENWGGMSGIKQLKALDKQLAEPAAQQALAMDLQNIHQTMQAMPLQILSVSEAAHQQAIDQTLSTLWKKQAAGGKTFDPRPCREHRQTGWLANSQINFCAKAYATVTSGHPDSAALQVLGGFLRNGYLHTAIREKGGAYGGGASQDNNTAIFRFYSYRDPRLSETLADFDAAIDWMLNKKHLPQQLEEAILGVISSLDKPGSPAGEAKKAFHNKLFGRTPEQQQHYRQQVLQVTLDDLKHVTKKYLQADNASVAVISGSKKREEMEKLGLAIQTL